MREPSSILRPPRSLISPKSQNSPDQGSVVPRGPELQENRRLRSRPHQLTSGSAERPMGRRWTRGPTRLRRYPEERLRQPRFLVGHSAEAITAIFSASANVSPARPASPLPRRASSHPASSFGVFTGGGAEDGV